MIKLKKILSELHPEVDFDAPHHLIEERILDSIDVVTLVGEIDEAYNLRVPVEELTPENFASVKTIYKLIERLRG